MTESCERWMDLVWAIRDRVPTEVCWSDSLREDICSLIEEKFRVEIESHRCRSEGRVSPGPFRMLLARAQAARW